jgi:hypothetical protein
MCVVRLAVTAPPAMTRPAQSGGASESKALPLNAAKFAANAAVGRMEEPSAGMGGSGAGEAISSGSPAGGPV